MTEFKTLKDIAINWGDQEVIDKLKAEAVKWYKNRTSASVCTDWLIFFNLTEADLKGKVVGVVDNLNDERVAELREEDLK